MIDESTVSSLFDAIESSIRLLIKEEVKAALLEFKYPSLKIHNPKKLEGDASDIHSDFPTLLTAKEAAELLGLKPARVYELARTSSTCGFPVIRIGEASVRFNKEALLRWLNRGQP